MKPALVLIKLALHACERGEVDIAAEALRGLLAMKEEEPKPAALDTRAVSSTEFAEMVSYSARHVWGLIARGVIPQEAVLGRGRSRRILIAPALDALRASGKVVAAPVDEIAREGAEHVRKRARWRVVRDPKGGRP